MIYPEKNDYSSDCRVTTVVTWYSDAATLHRLVAALVRQAQADNNSPAQDALVSFTSSHNSLSVLIPNDNLRVVTIRSRDIDLAHTLLLPQHMIMMLYGIQDTLSKLTGIFKRTSRKHLTQKVHYSE